VSLWDKEQGRECCVNGEARQPVPAFRGHARSTTPGTSWRALPTADHPARAATLAADESDRGAASLRPGKTFTPTRIHSLERNPACTPAPPLVFEDAPSLAGAAIKVSGASGYSQTYDIDSGTCGGRVHRKPHFDGPN